MKRLVSSGTPSPSFRPWCLWLFGLLSAFQTGSIAADEIASSEGAESLPALSPAETKWMETVRSGPETEQWVEAVLSLHSGSTATQALVETELATLEERLRSEEEHLGSEIESLLGKIKPSKVRVQRLEAWQTAYRHANEWLFDSVRFPVPEGGRATGPYIGYQEAKKRGDAAIAAFKPLDSQAQRRLKNLLKLKPRKTEVQLASWGAIQRAQSRLREARTALEARAQGKKARRRGFRFRRREERTTENLRDLSILLLELAAGRLEHAEEWIGGVRDPWHRFLAWRTYCESALAWNRSHPCGMNKQAVRGIVELNRYRMALGIQPLRHNEKLVKTAQGHSQEMLDLGYFGHNSPVESNKSPERRARNEGYAGRVTECCAGMSDPRSSVEAWKWDGGHHRAMIHWEWREVGCSWKGPCTLNPGGGSKTTPPGVRLD